MPVANAPPIDVFSVYDDPPGPIAEDYIIDPDYLLVSEIDISDTRQYGIYISIQHVITF